MCPSDTAAPTTFRQPGTRARSGSTFRDVYCSLCEIPIQYATECSILDVPVRHRRPDNLPATRHPRPFGATPQSCQATIFNARRHGNGPQPGEHAFQLLGNQPLSLAQGAGHLVGTGGLARTAGVALEHLDDVRYRMLNPGCARPTPPPRQPSGNPAPAPVRRYTAKLPGNHLQRPATRQRASTGRTCLSATR